MDVVKGQYGSAWLSGLVSSPTVNKIHFITDSIGKMGNIQNKLLKAFPGELIADCNEGSMLSMGLAIQAEEYHALVTGENALTYSNDLTNAAWAKTDTITVTKETLKDGTIWNKIVKADNQASKGIIQGTTFPARAVATGAHVQFELFVPPLGTNPAPCTSLSAYLVKYNGGPETGEKRINLTNLVPGKKYKVVASFDKSKLPNGSPSVWDSGNTIQLRIWPNNADGKAGTIYFRNANVSYKSPAGIENYTETGATVSAGTAAADAKLDLNEYIRSGIYATALVFGRNEANWSGNVGIDAKSYYRGYDKLISLCQRFTGNVVFANPPPKVHDTLNQFDPNDSYSLSSNNLNDAFNLLRSKYSSGINIYERFLALGMPPSECMWDSYHQNELGGDWIANWIAEAISKNVVSYPRPEIQGTAKHYIGGATTGNWLLNTEIDTTAYQGSFNSYLSTPLGLLNDIALVSSTSGDKVSYTGINGRQLHVHYRIADGNGTLYVKVNTGTARERTFGFNSNYVGMPSARRGYFVCELPYGDNTVDIVVNTGTVHFLGITVI